MPALHPVLELQALYMILIDMLLTPIAGSEATDGRSDDGKMDDNMTPEQRREVERRKLSIEEKRVADAAAEYRKRLADRDGAPAPKSIGGVTRAASIQHKVKSLLDENSQQPLQRKRQKVMEDIQIYPASQIRYQLGIHTPDHP
ncbi:hypothetical protein DID88_001577 [Monilinia fructigena]|uniref:Uncharacterized protein n=1 Tax=Monilinia fructigena TaxID=38457 RepID=A0A395IXH8_9HELO|nr:hypothetical protein DID88_001577 [Monilinia fructigena]